MDEQYVKPVCEKWFTRILFALPSFVSIILRAAVVGLYISAASSYTPPNKEIANLIDIGRYFIIALVILLFLTNTAVFFYKVFARTYHVFATLCIIELYSVAVSAAILMDPMTSNAFADAGLSSPKHGSSATYKNMAIAGIATGLVAMPINVICYTYRASKRMKMAIAMEQQMQMEMEQEHHEDDDNTAVSK